MARAWHLRALVLVALVAAHLGCAKQTATTKDATPPPKGSTAAPPSPERPPAGETPARAQPPAPPATATAPRAPAPAPVPPPAPVERPAPAAPPPVAAPPAPAEPRPEDFVDHAALKDVYFERGRTEIGRLGSRIMRENALWLVDNPGYLVLVEGHTDYTGSREENVMIAERRANAAMRFLVKEGVLDTRIMVVSHGSERPVCEEKTASCAAKNRRVHFRVKPQ